MSKYKVRYVQYVVGIHNPVVYEAGVQTTVVYYEGREVLQLCGRRESARRAKMAARYAREGI